MADLTAKMILELVDRLSGPAKLAARRMSALTRSATKMAKSFDRIKESGRQARRVIRQVGADAKKLPSMRGIGASGAVGRGRGGITEQGIWQRGTMASAGHEMTRMARTSAAVMLAPIKVLARFSEGMSKVAADTRNITKQEFEQLRAKAKEIGETTKFTATEAASGMHFLAKSSFDAKQQLEGIDHVMNLAAAGAIGIGRASDISTDILLAYGMEVKELAHVVDVLAVSSRMSTTDIGGMGQAMKHVAPIAKEYGQEFKETAAFVATFASMGLKGGMGGRNLKILMKSLVAPSDKAKKALRSLRVEGEQLKLTDATGEMRPMVDIFKDMAKAMRGMPGGERLKKMHEIFQAFGMVGGAGLIGQFADAMGETSKEGENLTLVEQILAANTDAAGAAAAAAAKRMNDLMGDWVKTESAVEGLALAVAESLNEDLRALLKDVTKTIQSFAKFANENKNLVKWVLISWASLALVAGVLGKLAITFSVVIRVIAGFKALHVAGTFGKIGASIGGAGKAASMLGAGLGKTIALLMTPAGLLAGGMIAGITAIIVYARNEMAKLREESAALKADILGWIPKTVAGQTTGQLGKREEVLTGRVEKEETRVGQRRAGLDWIDHVLGTTVDTTALEGLQAELRATREELAKREGAIPIAGPTAEQLGIKIKVEADVPVKMKIDLEDIPPGMRALVENLGLQGAGT